jgi:hypothetical protein
VPLVSFARGCWVFPVLRTRAAKRGRRVRPKGRPVRPRSPEG